MNFSSLFISVLLVLSTGSFVNATELSYARSASSSSISNKFKVGHDFRSSSKVALSLGQAVDQTGAEDTGSSSTKLSYRYKAENKNTFLVDLKSGNEFYFYDSQGVAFKAGISVLEKSKLNLGYAINEYKYSKIDSESLTQKTFSIGLDHAVSDEVSLGYELSSSSYSSRGSQTIVALNGESVSSSDINSYVSALSSRTSSFFIDFSQDEFVVGIGLGIDTPLIGTARTTSTEIYTDLSLSENWTLSLSYSRGRTIQSSTVTNTLSAGVMYAF